jgi:hypothetical protein
MSGCILAASDIIAASTHIREAPTRNEKSIWNVVSSSGKRKKFPSAHLFSRFCKEVATRLSSILMLAISRGAVPHHVHV